MCKTCIVVTQENKKNSDAEIVLIDGVEYSIDDVVWSDYESQYILNDDATETEDEGWVFNDNAIYCEREGKYRVNAVELYDCTFADESDTVELFDSGELALCSDTYSCGNGYYCSEYNLHQDYYFVCDGCNNICHNDYYGGGDDNLCTDCCPSRCDFVYDYGYKPNPIFFAKGEGTTFGIELEYNDAMTYDNDDINIFDDGVGENLFYAKADSSLSNGVEFVSHPFDMEWYRENKEKLAEFIESIEGTTGDSTGLHIHIGRKTLTDKQIENIVYLVNHNVSEWAMVSGRKTKHRAESYTDDDNGTCIQKSTKKRYSAVNLQPSQTIEIRTFRCSQNPMHILGRIELTMCLVDYCKKGRQRSGLMSHIRYMSTKHKFTSLKQLLKEKGL